ncbi:MAG: aminotransferase class III-fold pyridoxal phosphate-dependent enzyme [Hyphomicrobiales bacterium]|nr:aminotransferase class III-fold pyridoxal phosphate-dependent enzyme [Hyphomicrobiales bacterium]
MATNAEIFARREAAIPRGIGHSTPISAQRALNAEVWDVEGKRYVDFAGGIAVLNTGHCHPHVMAAVRAQMENFTHTCFQVLLYESYVTLAERLNKLVPIDGDTKTAFFTTGAEATENAIKMARAATGRAGVIAFTGGFDVTVEESLKYLNFLFKADIDPARVAALIIEPVQGEGGFHQAPPELMRALRKICDENGIVFIADEVQTGYGRTGKMFAMEHYDVKPDLITVAKSLAGGFPLSGVIGKAKIMDAADPGGLGGTYAGNPLAIAAAMAVLDVFEKEKLVDRANHIGERITTRLKKMQQRNDLVPIDSIRNVGAMIAFDIVKERGGDTPDAEMTKKVTQRATEEGLILLSCGVNFNTIRVLVPLTAQDEILDEGMEKLERALTA